MNLVTRGIILNIRELSDNDLILDVFTLKKGKMQVVAKGAKSSKSKISAASNLFLYGEFTIYMKTKWKRLNDIETIRSFYKLREDFDKLSFASYVSEVLNSVIVKNKKDKKLFILALKILQYTLEMDNYLLLKSIFEYKLLSIIGYQPQVEHCVECDGVIQNAPISFGIKNGGIICSNCKTDFQESLNISLKLRKILLFFQSSSIDEVMEVDIHEVYLKKINIILKKYIHFYLEKHNFKTEKFLNMMFN